MTAPANPPPTPTTPADAGTPPDPMRDVLSERERAQIDAAELLASYAEATETDDAAYLRKHLRRACGLVRTLAARLASAERERDRLREEVREFELNENCRAKG